MVSFRVLNELKNRQNFVAVDEVSQGVSVGKKTATEVERAQEAARRLSSLFDVHIKDSIVQKARLRAGTIQQYMLKSPKFKEFVLRNVKLFSGKSGTRILRMREKGKVAPSNQEGFSKRLEAENALIKGESEIHEMVAADMANFKFDIDVKAPTTIELSPALERAVDLNWAREAFNLPDVYDRTEVGKVHSEASNQDYEEVKAQGGGMPLGEESELAPPGGGGGVPSLQSLVNQPTN